MNESGLTHNILIASYLEPFLVAKIRNVDPRVRVIYEPDLIAAPRYDADHVGAEFQRTEEQENKWLSLLRKADILFDFDQTHMQDLPVLAPNVKWIQATSSGIGYKINKLQYDLRMPDTVFTSAKGVHAQPLAEFCLMVMLAFNKNFLSMIKSQKKNHWQPFSGTDLSNRTIGILGIGKVGQEVARLSKCLGMHVLGLKRDVAGIDPSSVHADELFSREEMDEVLKRSEYLVVILPHTPETEKTLGVKELAMLPKGAILINIGRGVVIDQSALIKALEAGHLAGAGLDVFEIEPLPESSPLWAMDNVIISPHSASTSDRENALITEIFCTNIKNYLAGEPLINVLDTTKMF